MPISSTFQEIFMVLFFPSKNCIYIYIYIYSLTSSAPNAFPKAAVTSLNVTGGWSALRSQTPTLGSRTNHSDITGRGGAKNQYNWDGRGKESI